MNDKPVSLLMGSEAPCCGVGLSGNIITSAEREVKDSRRSGMYQSCNFLTRFGKQSL